MVRGQHSQIQMVREHVRIQALGEDSFLTVADFVFRNHGGSTTVQMGFPESQYGVDAEGPEPLADFRVRPTLTHFRSWVDGNRVSVKRRPVRDEVCNALWVKTVRFKRGQTRRVRVSYISSSGGGASDGELWVSYQFTGGNWRGEVEESVLDVDLPRGSYLIRQRPDQMPPSPQQWRRANHLRFRWTHWQAQKDFDLYYYPVFPNNLLIKPNWGSFSTNAKPRYTPTSFDFPGSPPLPVVRGNGTADCILLQGRLWVAANAFAPKWDEKRRGVILTNGRKRAFISAKGATRRSSLWPLAPNGTFWISDGSSHRTLMIPARQITCALGGRFGLDLPHGRAIWVNGKTRLILNANH